MTLSRPRRFSSVKLGIGTCLVLTGIAMPLIVNVQNMQVYETLFLALRRSDKVYVVYAALKLVALNSMRCLPHYLGAFFIGESVEPNRALRYRQTTKVLIISAVIPVVYVLIERLYGIHYDFGVPAILLITLILMLEKADFTTVNIAKKAVMVVLLITSMQFLDVMPALNDFPFGRGEASIDIKLSARLLDAEDVLQFEATLLFALLFMGSILMLKLILDENRLLKFSQQKEQIERARSEQRLHALEQRTLLEMRNLVHDLKSPLTAAQALISVVKLDQPPGSQSVDYLGTAEYSLEHMSAMISEILYEDYASPVDSEHIVGVLLSQISDVGYGALLNVENGCPRAMVEVNEIRFVRALANLIENAKNALPEEGGRIALRIGKIEREGQGWVRFEIADNGCGIGEGAIRDIWTPGFSASGSSGLGLGFARQVVEQNHGVIQIASVEGKGTNIWIDMPESEESDA